MRSASRWEPSETSFRSWARAFGVELFLVIGSFVVSFGIVKTVLSLYSGKWAEAYGRKPVLTLGRLAALPISFVLILAPNWWWVTLGNVLLGVNQGVAWSMSMIPKIELAGPDERGLAAGIDETYGYTGDAVGAVLVGLTVDLLSSRRRSTERSSRWFSRERTRSSGWTRRTSNSGRTTRRSNPRF